MKKLTAAILTASMLLGLAACSPASGQPDDTDPPAVTDNNNRDSRDEQKVKPLESDPDESGSDSGQFQLRDISKFMLSGAPGLDIPIGPGEFDYANSFTEGTFEQWEQANLIYRTEMEAFRQPLENNSLGLDGFREIYRDFIIRTSTSVFQDSTFATGSGAYSPMSMYAAILLLSGCADEDTEQAILSFAGLENTQDAAHQAMDVLYRALQFINGDQAMTVANSIWLNQAMLEEGLLNQDTLDRLNTDYYAGTYKAPFGANEAEQAVADWTYNQTRGLIEAYPNADVYTIALLMNALYYKDAWADEFDPNATIPDAFNALTLGVLQDADFMRKVEDGMGCEAENYTAADLYSKNGYIRFFFPENGKTVQELLLSEEFLSEITDPELMRDKGGDYEITWSVPKFDASSDLNLTQAMLQAGLPINNASFTALSDKLDITVSQIRQLTHVKADEQGFEAAAITMAMLDNAAMMPGDQPRQLHMILDKPFGFVIMREDMPLFIGAVNSME